MRVALLQTAPRLGDLAGNLAELHEWLGKAAGCDLAVAPELATHGYHLGELTDVEPLACGDDRIVRLGGHGPAAIVGFAEARRSHQCNSAAVVDGGRVAVQRKLYLPTYRSWEEHKHFRPGGRLHRFELRGVRLAVIICNDLWQPVVPWLAVHGGAEVLVVIANSAATDNQEGQAGLKGQAGARQEGWARQEGRARLPGRARLESPMGGGAADVRGAWDVLLAHAALALQSYVVFVNRGGVEAGVRFWGGSRVLGMDGEPLALLGEEPGTGAAELDLGALRRHRRRDRKSVV